MSAFLGPGQPWERRTIDDSSSGADGVRSLDVNGDGLADLASGWEQAGITRVYLSNRDQRGPGWDAVTVGITPDVEDAVFFDADGDGMQDVISCSEGDTRMVMIHWAPPDLIHYQLAWEWKTETLYADGSQWMFAVPMDIDGRRGTDLIIGGKNEGASVGWLEAPSQPRQVQDWKFHLLSRAGWIMSIIPEDMDHDGDLDILLSDRRGELAGVRWLENPGPGSTDLTKSWKNHWVGLRGREVMFMDVFDFEGDGIKEIIVPHYFEDDWALSILKQSSYDDWREYPIHYPAASGQPKSAVVGDIDQDHRPDIVLAAQQMAQGVRGIVWLKFRRSPYDARWDVFDVSGPVGAKFDLSLLLDVDRDSDIDIINTEEQSGTNSGNTGLGLLWYENPAKP